MVRMSHTIETEIRGLPLVKSVSDFTLALKEAMGVVALLAKASEVGEKKALIGLVLTVEVEGSRFRLNEPERCMFFFGVGVLLCGCLASSMSLPAPSKDVVSDTVWYVEDLSTAE